MPTAWRHAAGRAGAVEERLVPGDAGQLLDEVELVLGNLQRLRPFQRQLDVPPEGLQGRGKAGTERAGHLVQQGAEPADHADQDGR